MRMPQRARPAAFRGEGSRDSGVAIPPAQIARNEARPQHVPSPPQGTALPRSFPALTRAAAWSSRGEWVFFGDGAWFQGWVRWERSHRGRKVRRAGSLPDIPRSGGNLTRPARFFRHPPISGISSAAPFCQNRGMATNGPRKDRRGPKARPDTDSSVSSVTPCRCPQCCSKPACRCASR